MMRNNFVTESIKKKSIRMRLNQVFFSFQSSLIELVLKNKHYRGKPRENLDARVENSVPL